MFKSRCSKTRCFTHLYAHSRVTLRPLPCNLSTYSLANSLLLPPLLSTCFFKKLDLSNSSSLLYHNLLLLLCYRPNHSNFCQCISFLVCLCLSNTRTYMAHEFFHDAYRHLHSLLPHLTYSFLIIAFSGMKSIIVI